MEDDFDKLAKAFASTPAPFGMSKEWPALQEGVAALAKWKKDTDARLTALEAAEKTGA